MQLGSESVLQGGVPFAVTLCLMRHLSILK